MNYDTFTVLTSTYATVADAVNDFETVKTVYHDSKMIDTFDAVVLEKKPDGKVRIVKTYEQPTRDGAKFGAGLGLATGLAIALFPGAAIGVGLFAATTAVTTAATTASGAVLGALAGHVTGGISRADLKDLGETLDTGTAGLVVVAASNIEEKLRTVLKNAVKTIHKQLKADEKALDRELKEAASEEAALAKR